MTEAPRTAAIDPEGLEGLNGLWRTLDDLKAALGRVSAVGGEAVARRAATLEAKIDAFEPAVTLIGQIKAGKTALLNAMVGQPGLLPSDVNPWTSVVTSLHLNSRRRPDNVSALFRFFDEEEWDRLVSTGGRLGELAQRAGSEDEQKEVRRQVLSMRERSRDRLGKRFEMLLGTSHSYAELSRDLIDRYVCHGGWDEDAGTDKGRFADITKLANLYLDIEGYPSGLCLRDTPGVNDTFMMREQITINTIRDSRLCVVVLSAHQALSTMDMALLRLIANVDAREVVLFVNRIDELDDPAEQVPEIEAGFRDTLAKHDVKADVRIVFGSAFWALHALGENLDDLPDASGRALELWAQSERNEAHFDALDGGVRELAWRLSGVPALHRCIAERIVAGPGRAMIEELRGELGNILTGIEAADAEIGLRRASMGAEAVDADALDARLREIEEAGARRLKETGEVALTTLRAQLERSQTVFAERAVEALMSHVEAYGSGEAWQYNPAGLRMMMRSGYQAFGAETEAAAQDVFGDAARAVEAVYVELFGMAEGAVSLTPPKPARLLPPATVGQTIALDLEVGWWKRWWRNLLGPKAALRAYEKLVMQETAPIVAELADDMAPAHVAQNAAKLDAFLDAQRSALEALLDAPATPDAAEADAAAEADGGAPDAKAEALAEARKLIDALAA